MSWIADRIAVKPPHPPPYVVEDMDSVRPLRLGSLLGVEWRVTPTAWIAPLWIAAFGEAVSFIARVGSGAGQRAVIGLVYGGLAAAGMLVHQLGAVVAGKLVGTPLRTVTFTATLAYNAYDESREEPSRVHVLRTLGDPAANLLVGVVMLAVYAAGVDSHFVLFFGILNVAFCCISLAPVPTLHGGVLLKHLRS